MIERACRLIVTETDLTKVLAATGTTGSLVIVPAG